MATRSIIAIEHDDTTVEAIYCHYGGSPEDNGKLLLENFSSRKKLRELLALGNVFKFYPRLHPVGEHTFECPRMETTIAFHRDRGDDWEKVGPKKFASIQTLLDTFTGYYDRNVEYLYVFTKRERWIVYMGWQFLDNILKLEKSNYGNTKFNCNRKLG